MSCLPPPHQLSTDELLNIAHVTNYPDISIRAMEEFVRRTSGTPCVKITITMDNCYIYFDTYEASPEVVSKLSKFGGQAHVSSTATQNAIFFNRAHPNGYQHALAYLRSLEIGPALIPAPQPVADLVIRKFGRDGWVGISVATDEAEKLIGKIVKGYGFWENGEAKNNGLEATFIINTALYPDVTALIIYFHSAFNTLRQLR